MSTLQRKTAGTGVAQYTEENISEVQTTCFAYIKASCDEQEEQFSI